MLLPGSAWWCWHFIDEPDVRARAALPPAVEDLLGFAVLRETFGDDGKVSERSFLKGIKRVRDKDAGLPPGTPVRTDEHPVQSFLWADYTPEAATDYRYTVRPVHGPHAKLLDVRTAEGTRVRITTEPEHDGRGGVSRQDMYFNRGVIGSQAFEREFPGVEPKGTDPGSAPMVWLSRGLFEGLREFVAQASDERFALRGAFYEFHYQPAVDAFGQAAENGADVQIVYEAEGGTGSYRDENEVALRRPACCVRVSRSRGPRSPGSATTSSPSCSKTGTRSRCGRARPTSPRVGSSARPTSATSCAPPRSRRPTSTTGRPSPATRPWAA